MQKVDPIDPQTRLVKRRRGTVSEHSHFRGAFAEWTIETDRPPNPPKIIVHNGQDRCGTPITVRDHRHWPMTGSMWTTKERLDEIINKRCIDYSNTQITYEWLLCDGSYYDPVLYNELYEILKKDHLPRTVCTAQHYHPIIREHDTTFNPFSDTTTEFGIRTPRKESMLIDRIFDFQGVLPTARTYIKT